MQCPNCRFENMPGIEVCGRCGGSLRLATATIDVHPPRAGKWKKRFRWSSLRRQSFRARDILTANVPRIGGGHVDDVPEGPLLLRLAVPGWAQIYCGRILLGRALLGLYCLLLFFAALFVGTELGSILFGLALACHAASIVDIVNVAGNELGWRISIFASCLAGVALAVYLPVGWLVTRLAVPITIAVDNPPFYAGDVMLYAPTRFGLVSPAPGKLVLYELPNVVLQAEGHVQYHVIGQRIDRILAGPGQRVVWHDGRLEVDGQRSLLVPVNPSNIPASFDLTAPAGHFVIFPSTLGVNIRGSTNSADLNRISLVPAADVLGEVYWRQHPWSRSGRIHQEL